MCCFILMREIASKTFSYPVNKYDGNVANTPTQSVEPELYWSKTAENLFEVGRLFLPQLWLLGASNN